jgi:hypothetical protein
LQILDSIRFVKRIPDAEINKSCERLRNVIQNLSDEEQKYLVKLAMKYNPATRALTGAILESLKGEDYADRLYKSLRGSTFFNLKLLYRTLPNNLKWHIK